MARCTRCTCPTVPPSSCDAERRRARLLFDHSGVFALLARPAEQVGKTIPHTDLSALKKRRTRRLSASCPGGGEAWDLILVMQPEDDYRTPTLMHRSNSSSLNM